MKTKDWINFWVVSLIWSTSFLFIKIAVEEVSPTMVVAFRTLFGALGLIGLFLINKKVKLEWRKIKPHIGDFLFLGFLNIFLPFMLISSAEQFIDSGVASILNGTNPFFAIILTPLFIKEERLTASKVAGLVIGFLGVLALMAPSLQNGWNSNVQGQLMMMGAALCYAIGAIYAKMRISDLAPQVAAFMQLFTASIFTWIFMLFTEQPLVFPSHANIWFALAWIGFLGASVAYYIYFSLLHQIGPARISMITYVIPFFGVVWGIAFLGESFYWQIFAGLVLIVGGVLLVNKRKKQAEPSA